MASEAVPATVRQFQSEIDAIRHAEEPLSVRATVLVVGAACSSPRSSWASPASIG